MIRATTPTFTFTIRDDSLNLANAENVYVTLAQNTRTITKTGEDVEITEPRTVSIWLTQEESLTLQEGTADCQINWTYISLDGIRRRAATLTKSIPVSKQLLKKVIE